MQSAVPSVPCATSIVRTLAACAIGFAATSASAAESGLTYFALGAQSVYAGMMPPPGATQFYGYTQFYDGNSLRDSDGNVVPGLDVQAIVAAPRVVHTWKQSYGGFNLSSGFFGLFANLGLSTPGGEFYDNGPVNIGIEPLYLSRSSGNWHYMGGLVFYIPWGDYSTQSPVNSTLNRYGGAFNGGLTWTPTARWDVSLNFGYEFKGRNQDTQYRDGAQASVTYGVGYRPLQDTRWDIGFSGYYTVQVEDDRQSGDKLPDTRLRKFVIGPKLGYTFAPGSAVILQWHRESQVTNAPRGDAYWVMFGFPI